MHLLYEYSPTTICFLKEVIDKVYPVTNELTRKLAMHFMSAECYQGQCKVTIDMLENEENYLPLNEDYVGFNTKHVVKKLFNDGSIDQNQCNKSWKLQWLFTKKV